MPNVSDLTLAATAAEELGVSAGDPLPRYIAAASDAIRSYLGRPTLHYAAAIVEKLPGLNRQRLVLSRPPVVSIASIAIDGSVVTSTEYEIEDADGGIVYRRWGWPFTGVSRGEIVQEDPLPGSAQKVIAVTYAGGWVTPWQADASQLNIPRTLPYDLEHACLLTVSGLYRRKGDDWGITSESLGDASQAFGGLNSAIGRGLGGIIPDAAVTILDRYKRASFG